MTVWMYGTMAAMIFYAFSQFADFPSWLCIVFGVISFVFFIIAAYTEGKYIQRIEMLERRMYDLEKGEIRRVLTEKKNKDGEDDG